MSPNRVVALLTPLCALAAGWAASWIAQNFPDANISKESLQAVFIGGMAAVVVPAVQWLHGWQKHEARQGEAERLALLQDATTAAQQPDSEVELEDLELPEDDFEADDLMELDELADDFELDEAEPASAGG
jgi:hypothetical protein